MVNQLYFKKNPTNQKEVSLVPVDNENYLMNICTYLQEMGNIV